MRKFSYLLLESRKEDLKNRYSKKFTEDVLDNILNNPELEKYNHKYTNFVLKNLNPEGDVNVMLSYVIPMINNFDSLQSQLEKKDINQYESFRELYSALQIPLEKKKEKDLGKELEKQVEKIYENDKYLVVRPLTEEASCKYGANTKWCVTQKGSGNFHIYTTGGQRLYFIISKEKLKQGVYSKIAIHIDNEGEPTYYDAQDRTFDNTEINLFNHVFSDIIEVLTKNYREKVLSRMEKYVYDIFQYKWNNTFEIKAEDFILFVEISGFNNVEGNSFGFSTINIKLSVVEDNEKNPLPETNFIINYENYDNKSLFFTLDSTYETIRNRIFDDETGEPYKEEFTIPYQKTQEQTAKNTSDIISDSIRSFLIKKFGN